MDLLYLNWLAELSDNLLFRQNLLLSIPVEELISDELSHPFSIKETQESRFVGWLR